jgi:hypothetical protein
MEKLIDARLNYPHTQWKYKQQEESTTENHEI